METFKEGGMWRLEGSIAGVQRAQLVDTLLEIQGALGLNPGFVHCIFFLPSYYIGNVDLADG